VGEWNLFQSPHRLMSPFWKDHEPEIRSGARRIPFSVLWARDAEVAMEGRGLHASEPGHPASDEDEASNVTWQNGD